MLFGLVAPLMGSDVGATVFATRSVGPPVTSDVAAELRSLAGDRRGAGQARADRDAARHGDAKAESIGVVGALREAVDVGRAVGARGRVEIRRRILP